MKKVVLAFALFAFIGASSAEATVIKGGEKEKTEKKEKKSKKNKKGTAGMKDCGSKEGSADGAKKSCCAKKASASTQTPSAQ